MKNGKVIIIILFVLVLLYSIGCNTTNEKNIGIDNNKNIYESKDTSENQSNEYIEEYEIKSNVVFYLLKDEYLENNDAKNPNVSELVRQFICYNGVKNQIYPFTNTVLLEKVSNIQEAREKLILKNTSELKLPPNTIVSSNVLKKWELQDYDGSNSYSEESPRGLNYSKIQ